MRSLCNVNCETILSQLIPVTTCAVQCQPWPGHSDTVTTHSPPRLFRTQRKSWESMLRDHCSNCRAAADRDFAAVTAELTWDGSSGRSTMPERPAARRRSSCTLPGGTSCTGAACWSEERRGRRMRSRASWTASPPASWAPYSPGQTGQSGSPGQAWNRENTNQYCMSRWIIITRKFWEVNGDCDEAIIWWEITDYLLFMRSLTSGNIFMFPPWMKSAVTVHRFIGSRLSLHGR